MIRRPPSTIIVAHTIDPRRRELYVEGSRDRAFINWLVGDRIGFHSSIVPIDLVEIPNAEFGGNRERLRRFLYEVVSAGKNIRGLIDADQSRVTGEDMPSNAWLTDLRDAEGYVIDEENIDAALRLGLGIERVSADTLLRSMYTVARYISAVRLASHSNDLRLPISDCELKRYSRADRSGVLSFNARRFLEAMIQEAGVSLREMGRIQTVIQEAETKLRDFTDAEISHGKDGMKLLTVQFRALGAADVADAAPVVWSTFRRERIGEFPALQEIEAYLTAV